MGAVAFVGMSGGVDSALAAALLVEEGFDVVGVYMRNWSRDLPGFACPWAEDLADAERVAVSLGIDLEVWDCEDEYKRTVVDYVIDSYKRGYTPNPDVMCNQTIKFGTFAQRAFDAGADLVATGHYARLLGGSTDGKPPRLARAACEHKDQTYFLWRVPGEAFDRVRFPLQDIPSKQDVRRMCAERGLGVEDKPDSDGICFVGPVGLRTFLLDALERRVGNVVEWETGLVLGQHDGAFLFTVGQRRGLNLGGGPARYVVATDCHSNVVYVTSNPQCEALWTSSLRLEDVRWVLGVPPTEGRYLVRTRHTGKLREVTLEHHGGGMVVLSFDEPVRTVAPGQSAVIYDGIVCLGGGLIARKEFEDL